MPDLASSLYIDAAIVLTVIVAMTIRRQLTATHPIVIYLIFHLFTFSARAWGLSQGADPFMGMTVAEARRGMWCADVFLVSFASAFLVLPGKRWTERVSQPRVLRPRVVWAVTCLMMPFGLFVLITRTASGGSGLTDSGYSSSYSTMATNWPVLIVVAFVYLYGFKWYLLLPLVVMLSRLAVQGESRFNLVLPCILLAQIYLDRRGMRLPNLRIMVGLTGLLVVFLPLDAIGSAYRTGTLDSQTLTTALEDSVESIKTGDSSDQAVFDMYAITLSQSDLYGHPQLGLHFADLVVLPVPRAWWPEKPATNEHIRNISTPGRPLATVGAVFTLPGEMYTDFRWLGLTLGAFIVGRLLLRWYCRAYATGYGSAQHFFYLIVAALLIQVYRDGLSSLPVFLLVRNAPLVAMLMLTLLSSPLAKESAVRKQRALNKRG